MKTFLPSLFLVIIIPHLNAQNIVPNASFEQVNRIPQDWMLNQEVFHAHLNLWSSPNGGSPDVFFVGNMGKFRHQRPNVNVSKHAPRTGKFMAGMKTYGCMSFTTHCKEYLQIKLSEPLRPGERYYAEFWVNPIETSVRVNNFGIHFSYDELSGGDGEEALWLPTTVQDSTIIEGRPNEWTRISGTFIAGCPCEYLIIGNFNMDGNTRARVVEGGLDYAFYFIDDITIRSLDAPPAKLTSLSLEVGTTIELDRIYFPHDEAILLPESYEQLNELLQLLQQQPKLHIQINGHTDAQGTDDYNISLSQRRAQAVLDFLTEKNIASERLLAKGFGESQAIASNETNEGRQMNRRVEFVILEK